MNIRNTLPALAAVLAVATSAAFATTPPYTLTGSYTISEDDDYSKSQGGPQITDQLSDPLDVSLTPGKETTPTDFFTASPYPSCKGACRGGTLNDPMSIVFNDLDVSGIGEIPQLSVTGTFTAKYSGSELPCAKGDKGSPSSGKTDCFLWTGAGNNYNGSTMLSASLGDGYDLDIFLYNAADWNVTPTIGFQIVTVPEPATLALFAAGLLALGWGASRRRSES
ncbi:MAG: PEP-CTERM sorting domain-containing protein [Steroidobacteraceae bacterium]